MYRLRRQFQSSWLALCSLRLLRGNLRCWHSAIRSKFSLDTGRSGSGNFWNLLWGMKMSVDSAEFITCEHFTGSDEHQKLCADRKWLSSHRLPKLWPSPRREWWSLRKVSVGRGWRKLCEYHATRWIQFTRLYLSPWRREPNFMN